MSVFNARSCFNKCDSLNNFLFQFFFDINICSESWEHDKRRLKDIVKEPFKVISHFRTSENSLSTTGGGYAIIYHERNFKVEDLNIPLHF